MQQTTIKQQSPTSIPQDYRFEMGAIVFFAWLLPIGIFKSLFLFIGLFLMGISEK